MVLEIRLEQYYWYDYKSYSCYLEIGKFSLKIPNFLFHICEKLFFALLKIAYWIYYKRKYEFYGDFELDVYCNQNEHFFFNYNSIKWNDTLLGRLKEFYIKI